MIVKEFRQMRRDHRTVGLMVGLPLMLLIVFGYAARFDVPDVDTKVMGANAVGFASSLPEPFEVSEVNPDGDAGEARSQLRDSEAGVVFVTSTEGGAVMFVDGIELFVAQSALRNLPDGARPEVLFNPQLETSTVMVPALIGFVLLFVGTVVTSLGVVREREQGTLEQLAVMPLRPVDVAVGKLVPYFVVAAVDMVVITVVGLLLFDMPFEGSLVLFALFGLVFLFVVLGLGVAISTLSSSQGEAIQLAIMTLLPQIMLSGMIFPLDSMPTVIRWIGYCLPLTWFVEAMRAILVKGTSLDALAVPLLILAAMALAVSALALSRFRRELAPKQRDHAATSGAS